MAGVSIHPTLSPSQKELSEIGAAVVAAAVTDKVNIVNSQLGATAYCIVFEDAVALAASAKLVSSIRRKYPYAKFEQGVTDASVSHSRPLLSITLDERYANSWIKWRAGLVCDALFRGCVVALAIAMLAHFALSS